MFKKKAWIRNGCLCFVYRLFILLSAERLHIHVRYRMLNLESVLLYL